MAEKIKFTAEEQAFIDLALATIEMDSKKRLSAVAKDVLDRKNYVFDAHSHIFDGQCVDADYMIIRLLKFDDNPILKRLLEFLIKRIIKEEKNFTENMNSADFVENVYLQKILKQHSFNKKDVDNFSSKINKEKDLGILMNVDWNNVVDRIKDVIRILNSNKMEEVYNYFVKHAIQNNVPGKELISIQLGMDLESGWKGSIQKTYQEQTNELLALSQKQPILPFLPVHPERATKKLGDMNELYATFLRCFKKGSPNFYGIKCYPSLGYLPTARVLAPIFAVCEQANIPVITHCGGSMISTFADPVKTDFFGFEVNISEGDRKKNADALNEPHNWEAVLENFKQLRLSFGHFGGDEAWEKSKNTPAPRVSTILSYMHKYPNVYADFSFNFNDRKITKTFGSYFKSTDPNYAPFKTRSLFGTDFWVVVPQSDLEKDQKYFLKVTQGHHDNLLDKNVIAFLGLKD